MKDTEIKLIDVWNANETIKKLVDQNFPIKTAFKLVKIKELISKEYELIDQQRKELVKKYDPEGKKVPEESIAAFINDFNSFLLSESVTFPYFPKISLNSLPDDIKLSVNEVQGLYFIFDDIDVIIEDDTPVITETTVL